MRVVIDTSPLKTAHKTRGIGAYTRSLIQALQEVDRENTYILTSKPNEVEADLIHYPFFDFFFLTLPLIKRIPTVVTIHDTIPLVYPQAYPPGFRGKLKFQIQKMSLASVRAILTDSDCSKRDIEAYLHQPPSRVFRVYLAAQKGYKRTLDQEVKAIKSKYQLNRPYLMYVGDINYNKNVEGLIEAYRWVAGDLDLVLVSRGLAEKSPEAQKIHLLIEDYRLKEKVKILTGVPHDPLNEQCALYSAAEWYVQPSRYEGFGLPVLEAIACQTPVIISQAGSLPEITPPDGAIIFNPNGNPTLTEALKQAVTKTKNQKEAIVKKANQFGEQFTWEKTARETISVYRHALDLSA